MLNSCCFFSFRSNNAWAKGMTALGMLMFSLSVKAGESPAATPPMGWNSWNTFGPAVSEEVVRGVVDDMVTMGLKDLGYQYVVLDDHWEGGRDAQGHLLANPEKFPHGIKSLADYIHSKGLKLGIYSDAGDETCGGEVGSHGHEEDDAATFAKWGWIM